MPTLEIHLDPTASDAIEPRAGVPSINEEPAAPLAAVAPCGPECRFASPLAAWPDYVWCARRGAPQGINQAYDCAFFAPCGPGAPHVDSAVPPPRRDEISLTLFA